MPYVADDAFLRLDATGIFRVLGGSFPPFDLLWMCETLEDYVERVTEESSEEDLRNKIKENRLLYELGEITKEEYEKMNGKLNHQRRMNNRLNGTRIKQRTDLFNSDAHISPARD